MASLNLSSNGPSISKSYQTVVDASLPKGSPTYGQWAVFSVSTPLVNAFQQDTGNKESVLRVQSSGEGELADLIEEFSEGKVQFAYVKVIDPNTALPKNVLVAWCGEGVPERTKGYFTSHLSAVSKFLHGYHVQVTARSDGDLTPEGIIQKVADASGSKYSNKAEAPVTSASKPAIASKPVFTPTRTGGVNTGPVAGVRNPGIPRRDNVDDDGWGPDAPPVTRSQLEKVQPAYKPTKVNMNELKSEKQPTASARADNTAENDESVVRGGYQPVGKVDIAAIRRQARETGDLKDDRPEPVKGAYEPVGKVDIAAIRTKAQKPSDIPESATSQRTSGLATSSEPTPTYDSPERLTSLPKPKVSNKFGPGPAFPGTKPPIPGNSASKPLTASSQVGSASRTFADQGGKTPAQLWAEKKAKERGMDDDPVSSTSTVADSPVQSQDTGKGEWKSSYTGKTWAPVQTTHTGKSIGSSTSQQATQPAADEGEVEDQAPQQSVSALRDQLAREQPYDSKGPAIPGSTFPRASTGADGGHEPEVSQVLPTPPQQPRSPTPPTPPPVRDASPIRVAMPVGRGVADAHDEQRSPPPAMPTESLQQVVPDERDLEDRPHDIARAAAEATVGDHPQVAGVRALVQYDYDKAEDNEIELREGEFVTEIEMVDKDWWLGVNSRGQHGLFPSNYVEVVEADEPGHMPSEIHPHGHESAEIGVSSDTLAAHDSSEPTGDTSATAVYDYEAAEDNELSFPEGAEITNIEFPDDDWWFGEYKGRRGLFPANYVELSK